MSLERKDQRKSEERQMLGKAEREGWAFPDHNVGWVWCVSEAAT